LHKEIQLMLLQFFPLAKLLHTQGAHQGLDPGGLPSHTVAENEENFLRKLDASQMR
jgi:hypothetical protein